MRFLAGLTVELQPSAPRQEVLLQFEALKQHQAQQEASGARQEAGAARAPERSTLQQQPKASTALHQSQGTSVFTAVLQSWHWVAGLRLSQEVKHWS